MCPIAKQTPIVSDAAPRGVVSLSPGRSVEGAATGKSVPEEYSCRPGPIDVPLRNWDICPLPAAFPTK